MGVTVTVVAPHGCRGHGHCTTWVSWSQSLHRVGVMVVVFAPRGCHGHGLCATWVSQSRSLCHMGVTVMVFAPHVVSLSQSLCHIWCCHCCLCAVWVS